MNKNYKSFKDLGILSIVIIVTAVSVFLLINQNYFVSYEQDLFSSISDDVFLDETNDTRQSSTYTDPSNVFAIKYRNPWLLEKNDDSKKNPFIEKEINEPIKSIIFNRPSSDGYVYINIAVIDKKTFKINNEISLEKLAPKILKIVKPQIQNFNLFSGFNFTNYKIGSNNSAVSFVGIGDPIDIHESNYAILTVSSLFPDLLVIGTYYAPQTEYETFIKDFEFMLASFRLL